MKKHAKTDLLLFVRRKAIAIFTFMLTMAVVAGCMGSDSKKDRTAGGFDVIQDAETVQGIDIKSSTAVAAPIVYQVYHNPYGLDDLYGSKEVTPDPCERVPRDPIEGQQVVINASITPVDRNQELWVSWTKNGQKQPVIFGKRSIYEKDRTIWSVNLGEFKQGDKISYTVHAGANGQAVRSTETFDFTVTGWDYVDQVLDVRNMGNRVEIECSSQSGKFRPIISISFSDNGHIRLQMDPLGKGPFSPGSTKYSLDESVSDHILINADGIKVKIYKNPYGMEVYKQDVSLAVREYDLEKGMNLKFLTDGNKAIRRIEHNLFSPEDESFHGFGMRYDTLNQRGKNIDTYCVNWYLDQGDKTYIPIPFYFTNHGYGYYVNSTYYSQFRLATDDDDRCSILVNTGGEVNTVYDAYLFTGESNQEIIKQYTSVVGKPQLPPVWAFGPWISANEWNRQEEIEEQIRKTVENDIATSVIVIEAWSDEETFYIFNDAVHTTKNGDYVPKLEDFTFRGRWPDPKGMVDYAHENNIKVLLWQIPVLKNSNTATLQSKNDQAYAIKNGFVLKNESGEAYRMPPGWFGGSLLVDFTSKEASEWFLSKRKYLIEEIGIDGFKCDGGEFVWGREVVSYDGTRGDELRNAYPDKYLKAYSEFAKKYNPEAILFNRAGGVQAAQNSISWTGDQRSSFSAYKDALRACMNASMSGIPFIAWDAAGFNDDIPSAELYKRSVAQAAFSPIMQVHSESPGDPKPSRARTPWNMAERTGDEDCINVYRKFSNMRMNLLPYLYTEARYTSITGIPMMRSMVFEYPEFTEKAEDLFQYMLGGSLLVAPVVEKGVKEWKVFLPEGEWYDLFSGRKYEGDQTIICEADVDAIPVFVKSGSIIPMNLNRQYQFGGKIGNDTDSFDNLVFRIYPAEKTSYVMYDYTSMKEISVRVSENKDKNGIHVEISPFGADCILNVFTAKPKTVSIGNKNIQEHKSLDKLASSDEGYYFDEVSGSVYIKVQRSMKERKVTIS